LKAGVASLLFIVIVPAFTPTVPGFAVMVNVEVEPAAIGLDGVNVPSTNPELVTIEEIFNGASPVFLIVIVVGELTGVLIVAVPRSNSGELFAVIVVAPCETTITGTAPVARTFNLNIPAVGSLLFIVIDPVFKPALPGVAVMVNVEVAPEAIAVEGVSVPVANPELLVIDEIVNVPSPVF